MSERTEKYCYRGKHMILLLGKNKVRVHYGFDHLIGSPTVHCHPMLAVPCQPDLIGFKYKCGSPSLISRVSRHPPNDKIVEECKAIVVQPPLASLLDQVC